MTITALNDAPQRRTRMSRKALAIGLIAVTSVAYALVGPASPAHADSTVTTAAGFVADVNGATAATTITLGANIAVSPTDGAVAPPVGIPVTIDLAGFDLSITAPDANPGIFVDTAANLTITDSVGGGGLALVGGPDATNAGSGLHIQGTVTIRVDTASITGAASDAGQNAGHGIYVSAGNLAVDGTELTATGGGGAGAAGYGMRVIAVSQVFIVGGSDVRAVGGAAAISSHGMINATESVLRVMDSGLTVVGANGSVTDLINEGAVVISNGGLDASSITTASNLYNPGTLVAVDSALILGSVGGPYPLPITLDGNGGTPAEVIVYGESINDGLDLLTAPSDVWPPVRPGYTLAGWFTAPTGGTELPTSVFDAEIVASGTLYAQWAADAAAPVDPADPELAATGVTDTSGPIIAGSLLLVGLLTLGGAVIARRRA